jgi:hypothetical protein
MPALVTSPIILFLGAGATAPLGKMLMNQFVSHLSQIPEISMSRLFQDIISKDVDLEFLLEELQDIERKEYLKDRDSGGSEVRLRPRLGPSPEYSAVRPVSNWFSREAATLRKRIEREVYDSYRSFDSANERKIKNHFAPLFGLIAKNLTSDQPIIIFTTNYDPAVEHFCTQCAEEFQLSDGFEYDPRLRQSLWSPRAFENLAPLQSGKRLVILVKLHGSTDWFDSSHGIVRGLDLYSADDHVHRNAIIYPAKRKVAIDEPFFTAYFCLHEMLVHARCLLSVGYSFRDYDGLTRIMAAQRRNPRLRIAVLAPDAHDIDARELACHGLDSVQTIPHRYDPSDTQFSMTLSLIEKWLVDATRGES